MTPLHELFLERTGNEAAATLNELLVLGLIGIMGLVLLLLICAVVKKGFLKLTEFIRYKETLEKKAVPGEFSFDFEIYYWDRDIKEEEVIKNPTFDEVKLQEPTFEFRSSLPDREEPLFTTLTLKKNGLWSPDGWNGSPDDTDRQVVSTVHIVPTDRETSYTTAEIWHWRACNRRQLRKEKEAGEVHRHGGRCKRIKSVKHVFWHIKSSR